MKEGEFMEQEQLNEAMRQECLNRLAILNLGHTVIEDFSQKNKVFVSTIGNDTLEEATSTNIQTIKILEETGKTKIYHIVHLLIENGYRDYYLYVKASNQDEWKNEQKDLYNGFAEAVIDEHTVLSRAVGIECEDGIIKQFK